MFVGVLLLAGCTARVPVVTTPVSIYPEYLFPIVPDEFLTSVEASLHEEAWRIFQSGDLVSAELQYLELLESSPKFYPAETGLGWLNIARGGFLDALSYFDRAVMGEPTYVPALIGRGESLLELDESEEALESFERALAIDPALVKVRRIVEELRLTVVSRQLEFMNRQLETARRYAADGQFEEAKVTYQEVISTSPDSGFLYVELGRVEQAQGNLNKALEYVQRAKALDSSDLAIFFLEGELYEESENLEAAIVAFEHAYDLDPSEETSRRIDGLNERIRVAELPPEILAISAKKSVTRGELAALIGQRFPSLLLGATLGRTVIITDTRDYWGHAWILNVAQAGVMEVDAGYRFEPARELRRGELAEVVDAMLDLFVNIDPEAASSWVAEKLEFSDMRPGHLNYESAVRAITAGVLDLFEGNTFQPTREVAGGEAAEAVDRLAQLARELQ
jgi:tetratricopeptide (TPR) repeat protein